MKVLAIDPGTTQSAWLEYVDRRPVQFGIDTNSRMLDRLKSYFAGNWYLAIEQMESFGMPVGKEIFQTVFWSGRFVEAFDGEHIAQVTRREVKLHLCGSARAKDANIRQALIDRWGGKEKAIGCKASPGPLYGIKRDLWSSLAIAVTYCETVAVEGE